MNITLKVAALACAATLAACGGGSDNATSTPATKAKAISYFGLPRNAAVATTAKADVVTASSKAALLPGAVDTTNALQAALQAKGVPITVSPEVMDGTTLHALIMGENNGLPPTPDQFKTVPSEWLIANFKLDDMVTDATSAPQQAALNQFQTDLTTFIQRAQVAGKRVFIIAPMPTCTIDNEGLSVPSVLQQAESRATLTAFADIVGSVNRADLPADWKDHMSADCLTPDASLLSIQTDRIASRISELYALDLQGK